MGDTDDWKGGVILIEDGSFEVECARQRVAEEMVKAQAKMKAIEELSNLGGIEVDVNSPEMLEMCLNTIKSREPEPNVGSVCFSPATKILMANGSMLEVKDVKVGDSIRSPGGGSSTVLAHTVQRILCQHLIKIGDMTISKSHEIQLNGEWMPARRHPAAQWIYGGEELHNFITSDRAPVVLKINDPLSSQSDSYELCGSVLGTDVPGHRKSNNPDHVPALHKLWCSRHIADLLRLHRQWPNIDFNASIPFFQVLKCGKFAERYLECMGDTDDWKGGVILIEDGSFEAEEAAKAQAKMEAGRVNERKRVFRRGCSKGRPIDFHQQRVINVN